MIFPVFLIDNKRRIVNFRTIFAKFLCFDGYPMKKMYGIFFFLLNFTTLFPFFRCTFVLDFVEIVIGKIVLIGKKSLVCLILQFDRRHLTETTNLTTGMRNKVMLPRGIY